MRYHYNSAGYLAKISESAVAVPVTNTNNPVAYYTVTAMNACGQVTRATLGNGVVLDRTYQAASGYLHTMKATNGMSQELQKLTLSFDELGNLTQRRDQGRSKVTSLAKNVMEAFTYDNLNRLKTTRITGEASANVDTTYDARGNIKTKSGVGTYVYGNTSNRLVSVTPSGGTAMIYAYDSNGNLTSGDGRTLSYTSFDKPHTITKGTDQTVQFAYDGERARYKRSVTTGTGTNAVTTTTYYVGNVEIRNVTGGKQYTRYVEGHAIVKLTRNDTSRTAISTDYLITDHLGSIDAIADSSGALLYDLSFDAWGRRRAADSTFAIINTPATALTTLTPRGFTGHEMLDTVGLIHMNGRVYDPRLGRFTSADPIVQFPHYSQSFNRYSYVFNNPLSYTDPSGYLVKELGNVVGDILYLFEGGWTDPQAWIRLALDLKALFDELGGSGSGGNYNNPWVIQNLDGMGPVTAFGNQATIGQGVMGPSDTINQRPGILQNRVARAVIGVTYSDITGGKFANGAATAAFSRLFNDDPNGGRELAQQTNDNQNQQQQGNNSLNTDESKGIPTITGSADVGGQIFGGVFGASVSTGGVVDTLNPDLCSVTTACVQFGLGVFGGAGVSLGAGFSAEALRSGPTDSFGVFGNIGAFGAAAGGNINFGEGSVGGAKGFLGVGKGISGGVQFCRSSLSCIGD